MFVRDFSTDATERRRATILLARSAGLSQRDTAFAAGVARSTVQRTERLFEDADLEGLVDGRRLNGYRVVRRSEILALLPRLVTGQPDDCGWSRSTWTIEVVCLEVHRQLQVLVSEAQMGRLPHEAGYRRVSPKQTIALAAADQAEQIAQLRADPAEATAPDDVVLYEDGDWIIHRSRNTQRALAKLDGKVVLYFLPPYSPDYNPIERVWLDRHTAVTRNHRQPDIEALMRALKRYLADYDGRGGRRAGHLRAAA